MKKKTLKPLKENNQKAIQKIADKITYNIFNTNIIDIITRIGHSDIYHDGKYKITTNQIERILSDKSHKIKAASAAFDGKILIENAILDNVQKIATWLYEDDNTQKTLVCDSDEYDYVIGTGIKYQNKKLQECEGYQGTIVLQKADNEYGFTCITAYPNILKNSAKPTNRDIRPDLHETRAYQTTTKEQQAILDNAVLKGLEKPMTKPKHRSLPHNADELSHYEKTKTDNYDYEYD